MRERYHVRLEKAELTFSAAHFITYNDDVCERLHGHNYHVAVEVHGPLDKNQYVFDFIALRHELRKYVDLWEHRMLLPTGHPTIRVVNEGREVTVTHGDRRWVFPAGDCVLLPVANTTAELLARHLGKELWATLKATGA